MSLSSVFIVPFSPRIIFPALCCVVMLVGDSDVVQPEAYPRCSVLVREAQLSLKAAFKHCIGLLLRPDVKYEIAMQPGNGVLCCRPEQESGVMKIKAFLVSAMVMGCEAALAAPVQIEQKTQSYSVGMGATRIIYSLPSSGKTISVNNQNDYPVLVQSRVLSEDKVTAAPFTVVPPLFRLEGKQQSRLRIVSTKSPAVIDRESMNWLCVTGIPPKEDDLWSEKDSAKNKKNVATMDVKIKFTQCIKVFTRPASITGSPDDSAASLTWDRKGTQLIVRNPGPFYINLRTLKVGDKEIDNPEYIPPYSKKSWDITGVPSGIVSWTVITDLGGDSRKYKAKLHQQQ